MADKNNTQKENLSMPSLQELENELKRVKSKKSFGETIKDSISAFIDTISILLYRMKDLFCGFVKKLKPVKKGPKNQAVKTNTDDEAVMPSLSDFQEELKREHYKNSFLYMLRSTIFTLITVAAVAVLIAVLLLPVLQIYGSSMTPTLAEGNIVVSVKGDQFKTGDVIAFYYNNRILVKRVIGQPGDWIDIDNRGNVYVNGNHINEPYIDEKAIGECDIKLPYQVPESRIFVMGDHRSVSVDSRSSAIGCVAEEQIVGKIIFRVWPLQQFGSVK